MKKAIYKKTSHFVTAWLNPEAGEDWYLIQFENGSTINCHKRELEFI